MVGLKEGDVVYNTAKSPVNVNQSYSIKPGTKLYTVPWGTSKQVAGSVSGSGNQTFKASKQQQIDKSIYLYGSVNGKSGWVSKAYLVDTAKPTPAPTPKPSTPTTNNKLTVSALNGVAQINAKTMAYSLQFMTKLVSQQKKFKNICSNKRSKSRWQQILLS